MQMKIFQWQKKYQTCYRMQICTAFCPVQVAGIFSEQIDGEDDQPNVRWRETGKANRRATLRLEAGLDALSVNPFCAIIIS